MSERPVLHVVAAILRRGDDVVLVHQGAPGEPLHWSLPGAILEEGELVTEAVVREVREETSALIAASAHSHSSSTWTAGVR